MCSFLFGPRLQLPRGNPPAIRHRGCVLRGVRAVRGVGAGEKHPEKAVFFCRVLCLLLVHSARAVRVLNLRRNTGPYRGTCRAVTYKELGAPECPTFQIFHTQCCAKKSAAFAGGTPFPCRLGLVYFAKGVWPVSAHPWGRASGWGGAPPRGNA